MEIKKTPGYWEEPAHPMIFRLRNDLVTIYTHIREKYQKKIDSTFDQISREIGFVVTTTIPVVFEVGDKGTVERISMGAEHLKGTLFDKGLTKALEQLFDDPIPGTKGAYSLYLLWFEALKLKLRTYWVEPAHVLRRSVSEMSEREILTQPREPAHWFDSRIAMTAEEAVLISVIDEVYPELRLADLINQSRGALHG